MGMKRINLEAKETVRDLKRKISKELKFPMTRMKLQVGPIALERDGQTCSELLEHGQIINLKVGAPKRVASKEHRKDGNQKKRPSKKRKGQGPEVFHWEGKSPAEIACNLRLANGSGTGDSRSISDAGERIYMETMAEHRMKAAESDKYKIVELLDPSDFTSSAVSRGKKYLMVDFSWGRKKHKEVAALYDDATLRGIILEMVKTHTTRRRITVKSSLKVIGARAASMFSPPLFWSVCHLYPNQEVREAFEDLIVEAIETMIKEEKEAV